MLQQKIASMCIEDWLGLKLANTTNLPRGVNAIAFAPKPPKINANINTAKGYKAPQLGDPINVDPAKDQAAKLKPLPASKAMSDLGSFNQSMPSASPPPTPSMSGTSGGTK